MMREMDDLIEVYEEVVLLAQELTTNVPQIKEMYSSFLGKLEDQTRMVEERSSDFEKKSVSSLAELKAESDRIGLSLKRSAERAEQITKSCEELLKRAAAVAEKFQTAEAFQLSAEKRLTQLEQQIRTLSNQSHVVAPQTGRTTSQPALKPPTVAPKSQTIVSYFESQGFKIIDKRSSGGALWVVGSEKELAPHVKYVQQAFGATGQYGSGKATKEQPAWWTKSKG